jgi:hypothetical protein
MILRKPANFKCLGMTVTNWNCILQEIKSGLDLGNTCYNAVQSILFSLPSHLLHNSVSESTEVIMLVISY